MRTANARRRPWTVRPLGINPLIRRCDRIEALAILLAALIIAAAAPSAVFFGSGIYADRAQSVSEHMHSRHPVDATAVSPSTFPSRVAPNRSVQARWVTAFTERTELVGVDHDVKAGDRLTVWLDSDGNVVSPPETLSDARGYAAALTVALWLGVTVTSVACLVLLRAVLNSRRFHSWDREWQLLINNDDGWANRRS
jgi:hypothetical protein